MVIVNTAVVKSHLLRSKRGTYSIVVTRIHQNFQIVATINEKLRRGWRLRQVKSEIRSGIHGVGARTH